MLFFTDTGKGIPGDLFHMPRRGNGCIQVLKQAVGNIVDPPVLGELLLPFPGLLGDGGPADVFHLGENIELTEPVHLFTGISHSIQEFGVDVIDIPKVAQPV